MSHKKLGYTLLISSLAISFLVNQAEETGYILLSLAILLFFTSIYFICFAYPKRKILVPVSSTICSLILLLATYKSYAVSGIYYLISIRELMIVWPVLFFLLSLFIFRTIYPIDLERKKAGKLSILFAPLAISIIYFCIFLIIQMLETFAFAYNTFSSGGWDNLGTPLELSIERAISDHLPIIFVFIPIVIAIILTLIFYNLSKRLNSIQKITEKISLTVYVLLSITFILGYITFFYSAISKTTIMAMDAINSLSFFSFISSPVILLLYLKIKESQQ